MPVLTRKFYDRPTLEVAKELLGKYLVYDSPEGRLSGKIVETEAYAGRDDLASHASKGLTPRTALMYGEPGFWYIYMIYGFYFCLNIVTEKNDYPAAVLIRALEPAERIDLMKKRRYSGKKKVPQSESKIKVSLTSGPGKLCEALGIGKELNGTKAYNGKLFVEDHGETIAKSQIASAKRIGVDYAGKWKDKKWRFYLKDNPFVSKKINSYPLASKH